MNKVDRAYLYTRDRRWIRDGIVYGPKYIGAGWSSYTTACGISLGVDEQSQEGLCLTCLICLGQT